MATAMDEAFGEVVQALKDKGIYDNSVIIFSSDVSQYGSMDK